MGNAGAYVNFLRKQGDGFRGFYYDINDLLGKFALSFGKHQVGVKLDLYDERSNSTYLGLTVPQFQQNPDDNAVPNDFLKVRRYFGSLNHQWTITESALLNTTVYGYQTTRNWRRQDFDRADQGRDYAGIFGDSSVPGGAVFLRNSAGHRNRAFDVAAIESRLMLDHALFGIRGHFDGGVRYLYEQAKEQFLSGGTPTARSGLLRDDELRTGSAWSGFLQNRFSLTNRLTLTPGVRLERYEYQRHIFRARVGGVPTDVDIRENDLVFEVIPGVGLAYQPADHLTVFGGVHRGFAPPRIKDAIDNSGRTLRLEAERSWNYEVGARLNLLRGIRAEATFFVLDFENQIIPSSQSSGGSSFGLTNAGETLHRGVELLLSSDLGRLARLRQSILAEVRYTYLPRAEFRGGFIPGIGGNRLPYAPKDVVSLILGYRQPSGFGIQLDGTFVGEQFTDPLNILDATAGDPARGIAPTFDGQTGLIGSYMVWNLSVDYRVRRERFGVVPFISVKNLTNRLYIASRAPEGIQPGPFRQVNAGLRFQF